MARVEYVQVNPGGRVGSQHIPGSRESKLLLDRQVSQQYPPLRAIEEPQGRPRIVRLQEELPVWGIDPVEQTAIDRAAMKDEAGIRATHARAVRSGVLTDIAFASLLGTSLAFMGAKAVAPEVNTVQAAFSQYDTDTKDASIYGPDFLKKFHNELKGTRIGITFTPELFGVGLQDLDSAYMKHNNKQAMDALKFAHEQLGINDIRFGVRWDNVIDKHGNFDFRAYKPYFDYMLKNNIHVTFAFGIKEPWWPEDHAPVKVLNGLKSIPARNSVIGLDSELGQKSLAYVKTLFNYVRSTYSKQELSNIKVVQPENEPFQSYGDHGWTMSKEYLTALILEARKAFPQADVQINSAGFLNISPTIQLFEELIMKHPEMKNRLILGIDEYDFDIGYADLPIVGKIDILDPLRIKRIDPVVYAQILGNQYQMARDEAERIGFTIKISEGQINPWDHHTPLSAIDLNRLILRAVRRITYSNGCQNACVSNIDVWGYEDEYRNYLDKNAESAKKFWLIHAIDMEELLAK